LAGKLILSTFVAVWVAALGEALFVGGRRMAPLPWRVVGNLPLLNNAFPRRFVMHLFLLLGLMVAMWLARSRSPAAWAVALLAPVFLFPAPMLLNQHQ